MNKKGFELTINFLVVIILSLVVLGFGINFVYGLFKGGNEYVPRIDAMIMDELTRLCVDKKLVAVAPTDNMVIDKMRSATFGLRIRNVNPNLKVFLVRAECAQSMIGTQQDYVDGCHTGALQLIFERSEFQITNNAFYDVPIGVTVNNNAPSGEYLIYVSVCGFETVTSTCSTTGDANRYDSLQKIYVTVP